MIKGISAANVDPPAMPCRSFAFGHSAKEAERENFSGGDKAEFEAFKEPFVVC
jgi:hypothetical protein